MVPHHLWQADVSDKMRQRRIAIEDFRFLNRKISIKSFDQDAIVVLMILI